MRDDNNRKLLNTFKISHNNDEAEAHALVMGLVVCELMHSGRIISRKTICCKLIKRLEYCESPEEERLYYRLIRSLFGRH